MRLNINKDYLIFYSLIIFLGIFFSSYHESESTINLSGTLYSIGSLNSLLSYFRENQLFSILSNIGMFFCILAFIPKLIRLFAFLFWFLISILIANNLLLLQLHYAFLNLTLIHIALYFKQNNQLEIKKFKIHSKFLLLALFYLVFSISGLSKLFYSGWFDGSALKFSITRKFILQFFLNKNLEDMFYLVMGYITLFIEIFSFPLLLWKKTRLLIFLLNLCLHIFIMIFMPKIFNISIVLLLVHVYLYESEFMRS